MQGQPGANSIKMKTSKPTLPGNSDADASMKLTMCLCPRSSFWAKV